MRVVVEQPYFLARHISKPKASNLADVGISLKRTVKVPGSALQISWRDERPGAGAQRSRTRGRSMTRGLGGKQLPLLQAPVARMSRFAMAQPPYPGGDGVLVEPQAPVGLAGLMLGFGQGWILRLASVVPGESYLYQFEGEIFAEDGDSPKYMPVAGVLHLNSDDLPADHAGSEALGLVAEGLAELGAVGALEVDLYPIGAAGNDDGVAVDDRDAAVEPVSAGVQGESCRQQREGDDRQ